MTYRYPFTQAEFEAASKGWGANCGPGALAFALQVGLDVVRPAIPEFDARRYTSPTMMRQALDKLGVTWTQNAVAGRPKMPGEEPEIPFGELIALVRIQWTGPWTAPGANPKWAYRQSHWIAAWRDAQGAKVFDVNGGVMTFAHWKVEIVPLLTALYPRADGRWYPTHCWRVMNFLRPHRSETCATAAEGGGA